MELLDVSRMEKRETDGFHQRMGPCNEAYHVVAIGGGPAGAGERAQHGAELLGGDEPVPVAVEHVERLPQVPLLHTIGSSASPSAGTDTGTSLPTDGADPRPPSIDGMARRLGWRSSATVRD